MLKFKHALITCIQENVFIRSDVAHKCPSVKDLIQK